MMVSDMKSAFGRLLLLAGLSALLWVSAGYAQFGNAPVKLDTVKLRDDLYVIHNDFVPGNTTVLITSQGVVLVDDKFEIDHDSIMAELRKITSQPVKYVVNTHHHGDHSGGNAKMQQLNAVVVASEQAVANMMEAKQPGLPTIAVDRHAHIYLGGQNVEIYHFGRAHTDGDVVVLFSAQRVLAAGDMFTFGDATPELIDYSGGGSSKEWTKTLDGALELDFETVVPGHGVVTTKQEMRKFRDSTIRLRNRVHELIVQKKNRDDIAQALRGEFHWEDLHLQRGLDGVIAENQ
jgi:glyoxylase-like metal-dependent hydrolase (beta-lactamase superfamily II)